MRLREQEFDAQAPDNTWLVVRLDGRGFSSFTEEFYEKPFDHSFHSTTLSVAEDCINEFSAVYAYVASDEISLLFSPSWIEFNRRIQKVTSLVAGMASACFTAKVMCPMTFDARVLSFEKSIDVQAYFYWRLNDVRRCALQTAAYWTIRNRQGMSGRQADRLLKNATVEGKRKILSGYGINYDEAPAWQRQGTGLYWETYEKKGYDPISKLNVMATRRRIAQEEHALCSLDNILAGEGEAKC
jgi:tRNA(His) 5'-end guanylyltransferase